MSSASPVEREGEPAARSQKNARPGEAGADPRLGHGRGGLALGERMDEPPVDLRDDVPVRDARRGAEEDGPHDDRDQAAAEQAGAQERRAFLRGRQRREVRQRGRRDGRRGLLRDRRIRRRRRDPGVRRLRVRLRDGAAGEAQRGVGGPTRPGPLPSASNASM